MERTKLSAIIIVALLFCTGASVTKSLRLLHSATRMNDKDAKMAVAVGVPFYILAKKGLSLNPLEYAKGSAVAIERAAVDDPRLFKIESWGKSGVLVRGLEPGETTLHVEGRVGLQKESASLGIRTAVPTGAALVPLCGDAGQGTVWVGVGQPMVVEERLLNGTTVLMSDRYPEVDFGAFTPPVDIAAKLETSGTAGELIGPVQFEVRAPATPGPATLEIPEFGFTLPVEVFDASAVKEVRLVGDGRAREAGKTSVGIRFLVDGHVPCGSPMVPVEVAIGPDAFCVLETTGPFRRLPDEGRDHPTFEGVIGPQGLSIITKNGGGYCEISVLIKGAIAGMATMRVAIEAKPPAPKHSGTGGHHGGGHHHH